MKEGGGAAPAYYCHYTIVYDILSCLIVVSSVQGLHALKRPLVESIERKGVGRGGEHERKRGVERWKSIRESGRGRV